MAAVLLLLCALPVSAGTISSLSPSWIYGNTDGTMLYVFGAELGEVVVFDGPAGRFEVPADTAQQDVVSVWSPDEVRRAIGSHTVAVTGPGGASNAVRFDVVWHPLVLL
ncbi:MAG: hypothetical protein ACLGH0_06555, partial [Thermoanaerobaculia bacterium]